MIKRILIAIVALFIIAFLITWVLGGGIQQVEAAVPHYRDPFQYTSIYNWIMQIGTTSGETFKLPGTPSDYPTVSMPTGAATTSVGPTTVYTPGSGDSNGY
jgi:hypothetical protein